MTEGKQTAVTTAKKPPRVRWQCPNGIHPGVLGSRRPRRDDIIRYCLPCSEKTGRLVERVAPALERERDSGAERAATKAKAKRQRDAATRERKRQAETERYTVEGVDLREELKRLARLRAFGGRSGPLVTNPPTFDISRRTVMPRSTLGWASPWDNRLVVSTWPGMTLADAKETLVHELAHLVVGKDRMSQSWHGKEFQRVMDAAFREAYKVTPTFRENAYHGRYAAALRRSEKAKEQQ